MQDFAWPVPENTRISQRFGERPEFYNPLGFKAHPGIDFAIPEGTPIRAASWGVVVKVGHSKKGWGIYVKIKHDFYITLYAHLQCALTCQGCYITKGQLIGYSGNTGLSSGPHLHFGVRIPDSADNAYKGYIDPNQIINTSQSFNTEILDKIRREILQIKKDKYSKDSLYIHVKYIEKILSNK